jgi:hypothetical protein
MATDAARERLRHLAASAASSGLKKRAKEACQRLGVK